MVELRGFEPLTFCMPCSMVSSDGVALGPVTADQTGSGVWGRLAQSGGIWGRWDLVWSGFTGPPSSREVDRGNGITNDTMTLGDRESRRGRRAVRSAGRGQMGPAKRFACQWMPPGL
jgi:hypothetical protein